jgi:ferredoxin
MKKSIFGYSIIASCCCLGHTLAFSVSLVKSSQSKLQLHSSSERHTSGESPSFTEKPQISFSTTLKKKDGPTYPIQITHQGLTKIIHVEENESILQALERQSLACAPGLGLSNIPHDCRRGNCLTCASRLISTEHSAQTNLRANVNNGLSPALSSDLRKNGFVLTCCSYVTGPGVSLELEQNDELWDMVYRSRHSDVGQIGMEARARLLRRVDEENLGKWKKRMEKVWDSSHNRDNID